MHKILILAFVVGVVVWMGSSYKTRREEGQIVSSALTNGGKALERAGIPKNCVGKKYCITAFIAPWCGACNYTIPAFRSLNKYLPQNRPDIGFGLVIGAADASENESKQKELSDIESYVDNNNTIMEKRRIKGFPTWVVTNDSGKEIFRKPAGLTLPDDNSIRSFLNEMIGR